MTARGYLSLERAAESLPGVTTGGSPGDISDFSMRGFTGGQITILHNGLYLGPSNMTNRPQNTFNLQTVEILKGPASVIYGQGAIGGAVNVTNKAPTFGAPRYEAMVSYGTFGSWAVGVGGGGAISDRVAVRADASRTSTEGYVDDAPADTLNATLSALWRPTESIDVQLSVDYAEDHPSRYFGTPLVPVGFARDPLTDVVNRTDGYTVDGAMRDKNYNVADSKIYSHQIWPQLYVKWRLGDGITVQNFAYYFEAKRRWINSEVYAFNPATSLIDRDRFFVFHEQQLWGDQASLTVERPVFGRANRLLVGLDYSGLDFVRSRGFPDGDSVDPYNPTRGSFGAIVPRVSPTTWTDVAVFFEDALELTPVLKLVTGARLESLALDRENYGPTGAFQPNSSFERTYHPASYRVGLVYDLNPFVTPYLSWSTGSDPVGSNIFLVNAGENFDLSQSRQFEAGVKAATADGRVSGTLAVYDISRRNILTLTTRDTLTNVGEQNSRGFEATLDARITDAWSLGANLAYTDAVYEDFIDPNSGVDASGNTPANVPDWVLNTFSSLSGVAGLPLEIGGGVRYVGDRNGNSANTLKLNSYALVDAYATYDLTDTVAVSLRVANALDEDYVRWADIFYPTQVILGQPRSYSISLQAVF